MDNVIRKAEHQRVIESNTQQQARISRTRKTTLLKLQWLAERLRKVERIKKQLAAGTYGVDSSEVAKSLLGLEND